VSPVIDGTVAFAGAWAITIVTVEPAVAVAPPSGSWLSTVPDGDEPVVLDSVLTVNPASVSVELAACAVSPTTPGTFC
jgi:hypothetical protein